MKKLMIAIAAVAMGVVANAATVNWSSGTFTKTGLATGVSPYGAATVFAYEITQEQFNTYGDNMAKAYADKANWGDELGSKTIAANGKANMNSTSAAEAANWTAGSSHWVVFYSEFENGDTTYWYANTVAAPVGTGDNTTAIVNYGTTLHGGTTGSATSWTAVTVPEPTSGLMLLLGMAGLALRRRRA